MRHRFTDLLVTDLLGGAFAGWPHSRRHNVVALVVALGLIASACGTAEDTAPAAEDTAPAAEDTAPAAEDTAPAADLTPVRFIIPNPTFSLGLVPFRVAVDKDKGFYEAGGVAVEYVHTPGTPASIQALAEGNADLGGIDALSLANAVAEGVDNVKAVCTRRATNIFSTVVLEDSDIQDSSQLRGKTIGIPSLGTATHIASTLLVREAGLDPDQDVTFVPIESPAAQLNALNEGSIDALASFDDFIAVFRGQGAQLRVFRSEGLTYQWSFVGGNEEFIRSNPDAVVAVCRGLQQAIAYVKSCPAAGFEIYRNQGYEVPESDEAGIAIIEAVAERGYRAPDEGGGKWGWMPIEEMDPLAQLFAEAGVTSSYVPMAEHFTDEFIDRIQFDVGSIESMARADGGC